MDAAPVDYQLHTVVGMALFAIWPFTRLIHAFTAPLQYLFRPYIVYRRRPPASTPGARPATQATSSGAPIRPGRPVPTRHVTAMSTLWWVR